MYKFSVSGLRGKVFFNIFPYDFFIFTYHFSKNQREDKILLGYDTRPSSKIFYSPVISGIIQADKDVIDLGIIPTPTLVFASRILKLPGIIITASHNPLNENGLKFVSSKGRFLFEKEIKKFSFDDIKNLERKDVPKIESFNKELIYQKHLLKISRYKIFRDLSFGDLKIGIDCVNGSASSEINYFCNSLNLKASFLFCDTEIKKDFPRPPEPSGNSLRKLANFIKKEKLNLGIGFDPDGDRVAFVCENGEILSEEYTLPLILLYFLEKKKTPIVCNFSTSLLVNDVCEKFNVPLYRTKVGESNVVYQMLKRKSLIGGEGNGGVIVKDINLTRDGFVAFYIILSLIKEKDKPLSILKKNFNDYIIIKEKMAFEVKNFLKMKERIKNNFIKLFRKPYLINEEDGFFFFKRNFLFHLRPSNTENLLRVIINADDEKIANQVYEILK
ncbi:MAG: hypothetical protein ABIK78_04990 [candidate division WOR-3 bacterium]